MEAWLIDLDGVILNFFSWERKILRLLNKKFLRFFYFNIPIYEWIGYLLLERNSSSMRKRIDPVVKTIKLLKEKKKNVKIFIWTRRRDPYIEVDTEDTEIDGIIKKKQLEKMVGKFKKIILITDEFKDIEEVERKVGMRNVITIALTTTFSLREWKKYKQEKKKKNPYFPLFIFTPCRFKFFLINNSFSF